MEKKPIVLISEQEELSQNIICDWMAKHFEDSEKRFGDVIITSFVTNLQNDLDNDFVLFKLMTQAKQIFNLKKKIDLRESHLRKDFSDWLFLVSEKIQNQVDFDGELILVIEGVHLFKEKNSNWENDIKFWLPRELPNHIKLIISLSHNSKNISYLKKIGCQIINLNDPKVFSEIKTQKTFSESKLLTIRFNCKFGRIRYSNYA